MIFDLRLRTLFEDGVPKPVEGREKGGDHEGSISCNQTDRLLAAPAVDKTIQLDVLDLRKAKGLRPEQGSLFDPVGMEVDAGGRNVERIAENEEAEDRQDHMERPVIRMDAANQPGTAEGGEADGDEQDDAAGRKGGTKLHRPILNRGEISLPSSEPRGTNRSGSP